MSNSCSSHHITDIQKGRCPMTEKKKYCRCAKKLKVDADPCILYKHQMKQHAAWRVEKRWKRGDVRRHWHSFLQKTKRKGPACFGRGFKAVYWESNSLGLVWRPLLSWVKRGKKKKEKKSEMFLPCLCRGWMQCVLWHWKSFLCEWDLVNVVCLFFKAEKDII